MLNIKLTWESDITPDSFNVYRSTSTIDSTNLPEPVAINLTDKFFTDVNISPDIIYFYIVKSTINDKEYISEEVVASVSSQNLFIINENENYSPPSGLAVNFVMDG